ncbi:MAG: NAD(P)H-dependent oxidoreductase [Bacteroidia bacterium]|nr:NAD(P)H-dependent oxidoreductase [Bacteroidia bacterium]
MHRSFFVLEEVEWAILSCTHRPGSYTRRVALHIAHLVEKSGGTYHFIDFLALPRDFLFGHRSEAFRGVVELLAQQKYWIWVVPEYNGSFPGVVKVFIDALPREVLRGKWAALVGVSDGRFGNLRGLDHLSSILHYCGTNVIPYRAHLMHIQRHWQEAEERPDAEHEKELHLLLEKVRDLQSQG